MIKRRKKALDILEKELGPLTFGDMIKTIRLCEEWTQAEMAKKLNISCQNLCDIEKERKLVSPERAAKFAKILGQPVEFFIQISIQDSINQAGLPFKIEVKAS